MTNGAPLVTSAARYRGVFPVVPMTFTPSGELDLPSQLRCVDFMIDAGSKLCELIRLGGAAIAECSRWLPLINVENRQGGLLSAKALMHEGGVIACEAPRHPFPAMHPATRAGLIETARRLDPLVLRWGH